MSSRKDRFVVLLLALLGSTAAVFVLTGYTALYWAWVRRDLAAATPFLPWSRSFGLVAVLAATAATAVLFAWERFPVRLRVRLTLSMLATATIALFSEFRNEGKFCFGNRHHFLLPERWIHDGLSVLSPSLADFLYRVETSHFNDFLLGPAVTSVVYLVVFGSLLSAFRQQGPISLRGATLEGRPVEAEGRLRSARILMYVVLFWFFLQAWGEKAGYLSNPHSRDEIDLPLEFAGIVVGFWMARVLTRPFDDRVEEFRSTLLIDLLCSGVIGLVYTLIVGPLTESLGGAIGRSLYPAVPVSLETREYTQLEQHMRPLELLLLAAATWWSCNRLVRSDEIARSVEGPEEPEGQSPWHVLIPVAKAVGVAAVFLLVLATMLSIVQPEETGSAIFLVGTGLGAAAIAILATRRAGRERLTTLFGEDERARDNEQERAVENREPPE